MKKGELVEIKGLGIKELKEKAKVFNKEIADLVMDKNMKKLKNPKLISKKKKDLARVLTIIRQKELLAKLESRLPVESEETAADSARDQETDKKVSKKDKELKASKTGKEKTGS